MVSDIVVKSSISFRTWRAVWRSAVYSVDKFSENLSPDQADHSYILGFNLVPGYLRQLIIQPVPEGIFNIFY